MSDTATNGNAALLQLWRTVAIALMTFILGFGVPFVINQKAATKEDLANAVIPIQKQLDDTLAKDGERDKSQQQLSFDVMRIATKLNIPAQPVP